MTESYWIVVLDTPVSELTICVFLVPEACQNAHKLREPFTAGKLWRDRGQNQSGRINDGFIQQHDRNLVANRVNPAAFRTLQALAAIFHRQRFLAGRANQNIEQFLRNHASILRHRMIELVGVTDELP